VCLSFEHGMLPGNLHYSQPNPNSESLNAGILKARAPGHMAASPLLPHSAEHAVLLSAHAPSTVLHASLKWVLSAC
jgi:hypothetical protein